VKENIHSFLHELKTSGAFYTFVTVSGCDIVEYMSVGSVRNKFNSITCIILTKWKKK